MSEEKAPDPEETIKDQEVPGEQHPAVLVVQIPAENPGDLNIQVIPVNGMPVLSVPSLLKAAAKLQEQKLGIVG